MRIFQPNMMVLIIIRKIGHYHDNISHIAEPFLCLDPNRSQVLYSFRSPGAPLLIILSVGISKDFNINSMHI